MVSPRVHRIFLHALGWLLFFGLVLASSAINKQNSLAEIVSPAFLRFYATFLFLFYVNKNVLIPRLYLQKKQALYAVVIATLFVAVGILQPFDKIVKGQRESIAAPHRPPFYGPRQLHEPGNHGPRRDPMRFDIVSIFLFITVCTGSMALALFEQWRQTERRAAQAEVDKAKAELSFLKAQVNPHFLFNTLNNIYALAVEKSEQAPAAVLKLSNIMRYVTDDARNDFVPLADELTCISDYIALQQLRLNSKTNVQFHIVGSSAGLQIAPLLLMAFIENVFKYGISSHKASIITISITITDGELNLFTQNAIMLATDNARTGVGIENTKQRLLHVYPKQHALVLTNDSERYKVQLTLQL